jgi:hypothetical protein
MTTKSKKDFSKGKVYKIEPVCDHDEGDIFIGSTTKDYLSQRMVQHRSNYKRWINAIGTQVSVFKIFDKYGCENCNIILLESVNANCYNELVSRESHYIRTLQCVNKVIPNRTIEEYKEVNKERIKQIQLKYYNKNKETINEKSKQYNKENKDKIKKYYEENKDKSKKYYEDNKARINEVKKVYEEKQYICDCGSVCVLHKKARHLRTEKHQAYLNSLETVH